MSQLIFAGLLYFFPPNLKQQQPIYKDKYFSWNHIVAHISLE